MLSKHRDNIVLLTIIVRWGYISWWAESWRWWKPHCCCRSCTYSASCHRHDVIQQVLLKTKILNKYFQKIFDELLKICTVKTFKNSNFLKTNNLFLVIIRSSNTQSWVWSKVHSQPNLLIYFTSGSSFVITNNSHPLPGQPRKMDSLPASMGKKAIVMN